MRYESTRGLAAHKGFVDVLLEGLADDGGLYVPASYPQLGLSALRRSSYQEIAVSIFEAYAGSEIPASVLQRIMNEVYSPEIFGSEEITPLCALKHNVFLLKLSEGPTLAFKDIALQPLGLLLEHVLAERGERLNVLAATSGDTGSAAAYALKGRRGIKLFVLSPKGRMSRFQALQMYTLPDENIFNLVVDGTFDECQSTMKAVNADAAFKRAYKIGAVNSTNWARIVAQVVYYAYAWSRVAKSETDEVSFAVPSGNAGNFHSAHVARKMGLPIRDIIVCTNENDVLDEFFTRGTYRVRPSSEVIATSSPSMDIASASNFERYLFDLCDRDAATMRGYVQCVSNGWAMFYGKEKRFPGIPGMRSGSADQVQVKEAIRLVWQRYKTLIDPHTAVGVHVGLLNRGPHHVPLVVAETAQPAKFADTIREAVGFDPPVPEGLRDLESRTERTFEVPPDPEAVKAFIKAHA